MRQQPTPAAGKPAKSAPRKPRSAAGEPEEVIQTSFRLPRTRWQRLQQLSIEERASVQSIIVTALEAEFSKRGLPF